MASHRFLFFAPDADGAAASVTLSGDEHHHLSRVVRVRPGGEAFVTDGRGLMMACRVDRVDGGVTTLSVAGSWREEPGPEVTLALALVGRERFAQAVEQCVELGIRRVVPFVSAGSRVRRAGGGTVERLRRVAVSAMKQSFRAWLPRVDEPVDFAALLEEVARAGRAVFGDPGATAPVAPARGDTVVVVGPEAGLSGNEVAALRAAGAKGVRASSHRLRSETAAVALVSTLMQAD